MVVNMSKKHVSRKLKSAWRKHIDITDVEQFLEEQREDERTGGQIADRTDQELFHVEKGPAKGKETLRELRRKRFTELPRSLLPLVNTSNVSDPIVRRNVRKNRTVPATRPVVVKPVRFHKPHRTGGVAKSAPEDLWAKEDPVPVELKNEWIEQEQVYHTMANTGKRLVTNLPTRMDPPQRHVPLRKRLPAAGLSYNPAITDYLLLKEKVVQQEKAIIRKEEYLERELTRKVKTMSAEERARTQLAEMSEGLLRANRNHPDSEQEEEEEEEKVEDLEEKEEKESGGVGVGKNKKRITRAKKRAREVKEQEEKLLQRELAKLAEIDRVEEIAAQVEKESRRTERKAAERVRRKQAKRAKLDLPLDFVEPGQLSGSLRTIQPLNSLMATALPKVRKVSILKRTKAEVERKLRRIRTKRYTRSSHKEPGLTPAQLAKQTKSGQP